MNFYYVMTAVEVLPCSDIEAKRLAKMIEDHEEDEDAERSLFQTEIWEGKGLYLYADGSAANQSPEPENLPAEALQLIGEFLTKANMDALQFGVGCQGPHPQVGSAGGHFFRILANGKVEYPKWHWPSEKQIAHPKKEKIRFKLISIGRMEPHDDRTLDLHDCHAVLLVNHSEVDVDDSPCIETAKFTFSLCFRLTDGRVRVERIELHARSNKGETIHLRESQLDWKNTVIDPALLPEMPEGTTLNQFLQREAKAMRQGKGMMLGS
jgi:hypothetical protein